GLFRARHLRHAQLRIIGALAQELGVDRDERMARKAFADLAELVGCRNRLHVRRLIAQGGALVRPITRPRPPAPRIAIMLAPWLSSTARSIGNPQSPPAPPPSPQLRSCRVPRARPPFHPGPSRARAAA